MSDTIPISGRASWRSTPRARSVLILGAAGAAALQTTPALASDPAGLLSGLYLFGVLAPWVALNLVLTAVIAMKGGYRSVTSMKWHAAIGAAVPLVGLGVNAFDYLVVRIPSTPWPGIETILISAGLCTLGLAACLLAPLMVHHYAKARTDA